MGNNKKVELEEKNNHNNDEMDTKVEKRRMRRRSTMPFSFTVTTDPPITASSKTPMPSTDSKISNDDTKNMFDFRSVLKVRNKKGDNSLDEVDANHQHCNINISQDKATMQHRRQQQEKKWQQLTS